MFNSICPLKVQISQVLGPFFWIELLKTGRGSWLDMSGVATVVHVQTYTNTCLSLSLYIYIYIHITIKKTYIYIYISIYICIYVYIRAGVSPSGDEQTRFILPIVTCSSRRLSHACMYVCMYLYIYIYTYTYLKLGTCLHYYSNDPKSVTYGMSLASIDGLNMYICMYVCIYIYIYMLVINLMLCYIICY